MVKIITNGTVVTRDSQGKIIFDGAVVCQNNSIVEVGKATEIKQKYPDAEYIDAHGGIIMPGFINPHAHAYCSFTRGLGMKGFVPKNFMDNLKNKWWYIDSKFTLEQCRQMARVSFLEAIKNGVTTEFDHHASFGNITGSLSELGAAAKEIGIRACLCYEVSDRAGKENARKAVDENIAWLRQSEKEDCLTGMMGLHASFTLSDETMKYAIQQMEGNQAYHIHVAECMEDEEECVEKYGIRIIERLNRLGMLGKQTLIAHGVYLDEFELEQIKEKDAMVVSNPESNMNNAVDCPPGMELVHRGIVTGLGMDGFTHDMVSAWRIANALYKYVSRDINCGWEELPNMIFQGNAAIASRCFGKKIGGIEKGAAADIIVVNYFSPTPLDASNINAHILFGMSGKDVVTVMCNGNILMQDRKLIGIDEEKLYAEARIEAEKLWKQIEKRK